LGRAGKLVSTLADKLAADAQGDLELAESVSLLVAIKAVLQPRATFGTLAKDKILAIETLIDGHRDAAWVEELAKSLIAVGAPERLRSAPVVLEALPRLIERLAELDPDSLIEGGSS
jgi:hypothetical protein